MRLSDLVMPERTRQVLLRAVKEHRLPPAYLFVGPAGVGKRTTAVALAKALNCSTQSAESCEQCTICRRIDRQLHPDIHLVEPQGQVIKIDQVRQLRETLTLQAYEARKKVAIIDDASRLTTEASNALLKILEEPPLETLLVLICQHLGSLPATVISRAQVLRFGLLSRAQVVTLLLEHGHEPGEADRAACFTGGRPGAALALDLPLTLQRRAEALQLLTLAQAGDAAAMLATAEQWAKRKGDADVLLEMLLSLMRDLAVSRAAGDDTRLIHGDLYAELARRATAVPLATLWEIFEIAHSTQEAVKHNANLQLAFEVMLFKIGDAYERARPRDRQWQRSSLA
jgi:DNA polymerase III subunit delta'